MCTHVYVGQSVLDCERAHGTCGVLGWRWCASMVRKWAAECAKTGGDVRWRRLLWESAYNCTHTHDCRAHWTHPCMPSGARPCVHCLRAAQGPARIQKSEMHDASEVLGEILNCLHRAEGRAHMATAQGTCVCVRACVCVCVDCTVVPQHNRALGPGLL